MNTALFDLEADPGALRSAATGWRALANAVLASSADVSEEWSRVVGGAWSGDAAESYTQHLGDLFYDFGTSTLYMFDIARYLGLMADDLAEAQELLDLRLNALADFASLPQVMLLSEEDLAAAIEAAEDDARTIRSWLDDRLHDLRADLRGSNDFLRSVGDRWLPIAAGETTGWTPPPEVAGQVGVIRIGNRLVVNVADGVVPEGWTIRVTTDPETGEQVVWAEDVLSRGRMELYRAAARANLVIRSGPGSDDFLVGTAGITVLSGSGDDRVYAPRRTTVVGLGGNDEIHAGADSRVSGGAGGDELRTDDDVQVYGGLGDDFISSGSHGYLSGGEGGDRLRAEVNRLEGSGGSAIDGGSGNDTLVAGQGGNTLRGGMGHDDLATSASTSVLGTSGDRDHLDGQGGSDHASVDEHDRTESIEDETVARAED